MTEIQTLTLSEETPSLRLDKALATYLQGASRTQIKRWIVEEGVRVNGSVCISPSQQVSAGDVLEVCVQKKQAATEIVGENIPLNVVFEDEHLLVVDKPVGLVVHPGAGHQKGTLVHALVGRYGSSLSSVNELDRPGIVHRLDKDTSGLMVVAKTNAAHQGLAAQFEDRSLSRTYLAFVEGLLTPIEGTIDKNIGRSDQNRQKMAVFDLKGRPAVTHYATEQVFRSGKSLVASLVRCTLETGRTHQIRVHMASQGHPVMGDSLYGRHRKQAIFERMRQAFGCQLWQNHRQALHAHQLRFIHPITEEEHVFTSPLPEDLQELRSMLSMEDDV